MAQPTQAPSVPSVLGVQRHEFPQRPLISEETVLWGVFCHRADEDTPRPVAWLRSEADAQRWCVYVREQSDWSCPCGHRYEAHRPLTAPDFATQRAREQADAEYQRTQAREAEVAQRQAASSPEAPIAFSETMADPESDLPPPPDPTPTPKGTRGPHAERLERARAVHEAAKKAMPRKPVKRDIPKDPFEEDVPG